MRIQFLGTSAGTPTKQRNVSATALIESAGKAWYLIDCGEGTQHQLLHTKLSLGDLAGIFITHIHGDHCYGLPGLLASASLNKRTEPLTIIAPNELAQWLAATLKFTAVHLSFEINFVQAQSLADMSFGQFMLSTVKLSHRVDSFAYVFTERHKQFKLDVDKLNFLGVPRSALWGELQSGRAIEFNGKVITPQSVSLPLNKPRKVIICGDNDQPELLAQDCKDCDLLIHEATFIQSVGDKARETGHSSAKQIAQFAQSVNLTHLILTHFSSRYQKEAEPSSSINLIQDEAKTYFEGQLFLAEDFALYQLSKEFTLTLLK